MIASGEEEMPVASVSPEIADALGADWQQALLSPSIQRAVGEEMEAYELKFLLPEALAMRVQEWAASRMMPDAFADPRLGGAYQTTTLYLDTAERDVFHRAAGHRSRKFRLRRYGLGPRIYLERKTRRGDRVAKRRSDVGLEDLPTLTTSSLVGGWPGDWFHELITAKGLRPACRITYDRTAFVQMTADGPLRLTLDRQIRGQATESWDVTPLCHQQQGGHSILAEQVICEFKFRGAMPSLFKEAIQTLQLEVGGVSKYRRMMLATGTLGSEGAHA